MAVLKQGERRQIERTVQAALQTPKARQLDARMVGLDGRIDAVEDGLASNDGRLDAVEAGLPAKLEWVAAPEFSDDPGVAGQVAFESSFFYVCIATDTWERAALATFDASEAPGEAPVFESISSTTYGARTNTIIPAPASIADGDVLVAMLFMVVTTTADPPAAATPPAGWTSAGTDLAGTDSAVGARFACWTKTASGESGDYTFTHDLRSTQGKISRISGANAAPNAISSHGANSAADATRTAMSVTTTVPNCLLLYEGFDWGNPGGETPPTGFTERLSETILYSADAVQVSAGASGDVTNLCNSIAAEPRGAFLIALEPA